MLRAKKQRESALRRRLDAWHRENPRLLSDLARDIEVSRQYIGKFKAGGSMSEPAMEKLEQYLDAAQVKPDVPPNLGTQAEGGHFGDGVIDVYFNSERSPNAYRK